MGKEKSAYQYIQRDVDQQVWKIARSWIESNSQVRWLSLISTPGRGNTSLLNWLQQHASQNANFVTAIRTIFVKDAKAISEGPPRRIGPIAEAITALNSKKPLRGIRLVAKRIGSVGGKKLSVTALIILGALALGCVFKGLELYGELPETANYSIPHWLGSFFVDFLPKNWRNFPIWFGSASIVTVPLSIAMLFINRKRLFPSMPEELATDDIDSRHLRTVDGLTESLLEAVDDWRGTMLLIDDADCLPEVEKEFLANLFSPSPKNKNLHRFNREKSIFIVTVDYGESDIGLQLLDDARHRFEFLEVPEFELLELGEIMNSLFNETGKETPEKEKQKMLSAARHNVNALFSERNNEIIRGVGAEFVQAQVDGIQSVFGLDRLMVYQAVRQEPSVKKSELLEWLESLAKSSFLSAFKLQPPLSAQDMVIKFAKHSSLVHGSGETLYYDIQRCQALRDWLKEKFPLLLAQAHYYWFWRSWSKYSARQIDPSNTIQLSYDERHEIKVCAWHIARIGKITGLSSVQKVLADSRGISRDQQQEICLDVATALVTAAGIWRREGNLTEARDLHQDALEWVTGVDTDKQHDVIEKIASQTWENYWLSADDTSRGQLSRMYREFPFLALSASWQVHERYEQLLKCAETLTPLPAGVTLSNPSVSNLLALTDIMYDMRQNYGYVALALREGDISISDPLPTDGLSLAESHLWQLKTAALNRNDELSIVVQALKQRRDYLIAREPSCDGMGDVAIQSYNFARCWHLLADVMKAGVDSLDSDDLPADQREAALAQLTDTIALACPAPPQGIPLIDHLWQEARSEYERSLQIAALLSWQRLILELHFHLGTLLEAHTPKGRQQENPPWWRRWDNSFNQCIELEKTLGWIVYTPAIYRIRWKFFENRNREISVEDAYNAFIAAKQARFPAKVILNIHNQVNGLLTNFGHTDDDRRRSAELHVLWAHELVVLPEAAKWRVYRFVEYDQADALGYAAQSRRLLNELDSAELLLDEALSLLEKPSRAVESGETLADAPDIQTRDQYRDLKISLGMQQAWLREVQGRVDEYRSMIRDLWRTLKTDDGIAANTLWSLLSIEDEENLLGERWPKSNNAIYADLDNDNLSLPPAWFEDEDQLRIENRYEFRFHQFVHLVSPGQRPTGFHLSLAAGYLHWHGMNRFGELSIAIAVRGLRYDLSEQTKAVAVSLLEAVRFFFAEVEKVDRHELEALQALISYCPASVEYKISYIKVLVEYKELLKHELLVRKEEENWFGIVNKVDSYLGILVDTDLQSNQVVMEFRKKAVPLTQLPLIREQHTKALQEARAQMAAGDYTISLSTLAQVLPNEPLPWVFNYDLEILSLWLKCAKLRGLNSDELARRSNQMRKLVLDYIYQFSKIVKDVQVQYLALELLEWLKKATEFNTQQSSIPKAMGRTG